MDKCHLKAGKFLVIDLNTGSTTVVRRYTGKEQRVRKITFIKKNVDLCTRAFSQGHGHQYYRISASGMKLVDKARKKLGYSTKTGSGDIYMMVFCAFKAMYPDKSLLPTCTCGWCRNNRRSK